MRPMKKRYKYPWLAAILNFIIPGLGYLYTGKRMIFGGGLILLSVIYVSSTLNADMTYLDWAVGIPLSLLFAYDGYQTALEFNKRS